MVLPILRNHYHTFSFVPKKIQGVGHIKTFGWWAWEGHNPVKAIDASLVTAQANQYFRHFQTLVGDLHIAHLISQVCISNPLQAAMVKHQHPRYLLHT